MYFIKKLTKFVLSVFFVCSTLILETSAQELSIQELQERAERTEPSDSFLEQKIDIASDVLSSKSNMPTTEEIEELQDFLNGDESSEENNLTNYGDKCSGPAPECCGGRACKEDEQCVNTYNGQLECVKCDHTKSNNKHCLVCCKPDEVCFSFVHSGFDGCYKGCPEGRELCNLPDPNSRTGIEQKCCPEGTFCTKDKKGTKTGIRNFYYCSYCGDNYCERPRENESNCPQDCSTVKPKCNKNGVCETGEDSKNCPIDCGCNKNSVCEKQRGENNNNCKEDCKCPDGKRLIHGICCTENQVERNGKCADCPENTQVQGNNCVCKEGYELVGKKCLPKCPAGTKRVNGTCQPNCPPNFIWQNGTCVCPPPYIVNNNNCVVCDPTVNQTCGNNPGGGTPPPAGSGTCDVLVLCSSGYGTNYVNKCGPNKWCDANKKFTCIGNATSEWFYNQPICK